jgi:Uma2 family endonuclease
MNVAIKSVTADELLYMPDDGFRYELIKGELIKIAPPGGEHGVVTSSVNVLLARHVKARRLGVVFGGDTGFQLTSNPDTVLAPDVAFVRQSRIPPDGVPKGYWPGPPDLAVEIPSPWDTLKEAKEKVEKCLAPGRSWSGP